MYEQWAMLIDRIIIENSGDYTANRGDLTRQRALQYYRETLRYHVLYETCSMVTLHYFSKLLYTQTQLQSQQDDAISQNEYFLIYMVIQDAKTENNKVPLTVTPGIQKTMKSKLGSRGI